MVHASCACGDPLPRSVRITQAGCCPQRRRRGAAAHRIVVAGQQQLVDGYLDAKQQQAKKDGRRKEAHVAAPVAPLEHCILAVERARLALERGAAPGQRHGPALAQLPLVKAGRRGLLQHLHLSQWGRGQV